MKRAVLLAACLLLLPFVAQAAEGPCDEVEAVSVAVFLNQNMTPAADTQDFNGAPVPVFMVAGQEEILGCSSSDCRVCNDNGLRCKPVDGDCCCVEDES